MLAPRTAMAAPLADIWHTVDYGFTLGVDACILGDETVPDVCQRNISTNILECKAERLADGGTGAKMWMVRDTGDDELCDGYEYCAFGSIKLDEVDDELPFYCAWDGDDMDEMSLTGTPYGDYLYFYHYQNSLYNMEDHPGVDKVTGFIHGLGGIDWVHGSHYNADAVYADVLNGNGDGDTIWGHDGGDLINAGNGDDTVWAGGGNDVVHLVAGENQCSGEDGDDQVFGGDGVDMISLGDGDDSADGAEGADIICGDDDDDTIEGASQNDRLWGGNQTDSNDGGPGSDYCDAETESACETEQVGRMTLCPAVNEPSPAD